jgi:hypothetical protein
MARAHAAKAAIRAKALLSAQAKRDHYSQSEAGNHGFRDAISPSSDDLVRAARGHGSDCEQHAGKNDDNREDPGLDGPEHCSTSAKK